MALMAIKMAATRGGSSSMMMSLLGFMITEEPGNPQTCYPTRVTDGYIQTENNIEQSWRALAGFFVVGGVFLAPHPPGPIIPL
jgi:hypothetical protein